MISQIPLHSGEEQADIFFFADRIFFCMDAGNIQSDFRMAAEGGNTHAPLETDLIGRIQRSFGILDEKLLFALTGERSPQRFGPLRVRRRCR